MFFKKNYFVEFKYEGEEGKATGNTTIRCIPSMIPKIQKELKEMMINMGYKVDNVFITNIKKCNENY